MTTSLGAALVFLVKETSHRTRDALVGLSAGLMLSVTALNLLPKALGPNDQNLLQVVIGIALGATALFAADKYMPHIHGFLAPDRPITKGMKMTLMLVTALVIHNFPEGFATGTAYRRRSNGLRQHGCTGNSSTECPGGFPCLRSSEKSRLLYAKQFHHWSPVRFHRADLFDNGARRCRHISDASSVRTRLCCRRYAIRHLR